MARLPAQLLARAARARRVVEIGAGPSFATALALQAAHPGLDLLLTDVDPRVLQAPAPLRARLHDATRDPPQALGEADFVYAVRPPEELQAPIARLARALRADLALRPLKDEWADLAPHYLRWEAWGEGWRYYPHPG